MTAEDNLPKLVFNVKETQQITGLSRTSLWKAVKKGHLKRCHIGMDRLLFTLEAIKEFMTANSNKRKN
jgi:predicted DNA-binding transcriptional regulator AlpA